MTGSSNIVPVPLRDRTNSHQRIETYTDTGQDAAVLRPWDSPPAPRPNAPKSTSWARKPPRHRGGAPSLQRTPSSRHNHSVAATLYCNISELRMRARLPPGAPDQNRGGLRRSPICSTGIRLNPMAHAGESSRSTKSVTGDSSCGVFAKDDPASVRLFSMMSIS